MFFSDEDCELFKEVKRLEKLNEEELLYDMTVDSNEAIQKDEHPVPAITGDNTTLEDAYDNYSDFGVVYESRNNTNNVINQSFLITREITATIAETA